MQETYLSFYLKSNRIHVFVETLRGIGKPSRICFMIEENGKALLIVPYDKRDFKSHSVPPDVYNGKVRMEISSIRLCRMIADLHDWDLTCSYRVPGRVSSEQKVAIFDLTKAVVIERSEMEIS